MKSKHWVTLGMLFGALALMVGGLDHWEDAIKPQFVAGVFGTMGTVLKAMSEEGPKAEK